ncbi:MAG: thioredoxin domain-containing protein [Caulobacter sp.]|nr:thioredoxin domain-containing protein [Caulobacter sp.]
MIRIKLAAVLALMSAVLLGAPALAQDGPKVPVFAEGRVLGDPKAPVTMQAYLSFGCSHCIDWYASVFPVLKQRYIDTGKVRLVMVEAKAGHASLAEAGVIAARCAPKDRYFAVADALFRTRPKLLRGQDDVDAYGQQLLDTDRWAETAVATAGIDMKAWRACDRQAEASAFEGRMHKAMEEYPGYEGGTPVFVFNGEPGDGAALDWAEYSISRASKAAGKPLTTATRYDLFCAGGLTPAGGSEATVFEQRWSRQGDLWRLARGPAADKGAPAKLEAGGQLLGDGAREYLLDAKGNLKLKGGSGENLDAACAQIAPTPFPA